MSSASSLHSGRGSTPRSSSTEAHEDVMELKRQSTADEQLSENRQALDYQVAGFCSLNELAEVQKTNRILREENKKLETQLALQTEGIRKLERCLSECTTRERVLQHQLDEPVPVKTQGLEAGLDALSRTQDDENFVWLLAGTENLVKTLTELLTIINRGDNNTKKLIHGLNTLQDCTTRMVADWQLLIVRAHTATYHAFHHPQGRKLTLHIHGLSLALEDRYPEPDVGEDCVDRDAPSHTRRIMVPHPGERFEMLRNCVIAALGKWVSEQSVWEVWMWCRLRDVKEGEFLGETQWTGKEAGVNVVCDGYEGGVHLEKRAGEVRRRGRGLPVSRLPVKAARVSGGEGAGGEVL